MVVSPVQTGYQPVQFGFHVYIGLLLQGLHNGTDIHTPTLFCRPSGQQGWIVTPASRSVFKHYETLRNVYKYIKVFKMFYKQISTFFFQNFQN